jgi:hypothetical protein
MKHSPGGPFDAVRWFCRDGTVLPPRPNACDDHGGGLQHGRWSARAKLLRHNGYRIATVLASLDPAPFLGPEPDVDALAQILIERFLMLADDGWIFRGARSNRGSLQAEDESAGAQRLLKALLSQPFWQAPERFALLREAARLLPLQRDEATASRVRRLAAEIAKLDGAFGSLRTKIHDQPDPDDASRVREYALRQGVPALAERYGELATAIQALHTDTGARAGLEQAAIHTPDPDLYETLWSAADWLREARGPEQRLDAAGRVLEGLRDAFPGATPPDSALELLQASLLVEQEFFLAGSALSQQLPQASRLHRLAWLEDSLRALYGVGFIGRRHFETARASLGRIVRARRLTVAGYGEEVSYLARAPEWSARGLAFHFEPAEQRLLPLEPLVALFTPDRLRGSPLLFTASLLDALVADAHRLAGISHELFGRRVGSGLRALNPGLARGVLYARSDGPAHSLDPRGIHLLPASTPELPPVAGILTRGEGSSLSHVQLLARNLGIPNAVIGSKLLARVVAHDTRPAVLAVSPRGVVRLAHDGPAWNDVFGARESDASLEIRPDVAALDLSVVDFAPLTALRADDSGRICGPKGANLGELAHVFGDAVPDGFVIPFGVFRRLLDQPLEPGGPSVFEWMRQRYDALARLPSGATRERETAAFLARLRSWIESAEPGDAFRAKLIEGLGRLGPDGSFGVFVRSDTNVEDLPGFTGAGLNRTEPNVVGYANVLPAIRRVWASPFSERAFAWRQAHMPEPEYVFPAVVVQRSFDSEKSGVMVTADVDTGSPDWLSVAVNEGVGGAVEGQAAESLRIALAGDDVRFLARATAPERVVLAPAGGVRRERASGAEAVLQPHEIAELIALAGRVRERLASAAGDDGQPAPVDIEFAFRDGRLALLQIRPFVESRRARRDGYLQSLDAVFHERARATVTLRDVPEEPSS